MISPFRDLTPEQVAAISSRNRASRVNLTDKTRQEARKTIPDGSAPVAPIPTLATQPAPVSARNLDIPKAKAVLQIRLPWPPTVNHYWLAGKNGHRYISPEGLSFRAQVKMLAHGLPLTAGAVGITITAHPPDKRRRDLDNILKACLDALQHAGLIEDDSNVVDLRIYRAVAVKSGAVEVTIEGK